jgi:uncharacterized protein (TIGR02145 family)
MKTTLCMLGASLIALASCGSNSSSSSDGAAPASGLGVCSSASVDGQCSEFSGLSAASMDAVKNDCPSPGVWSQTPCPAAGRIGHCTQPRNPGTAIFYYYAPVVATDAMKWCAGLSGTWANSSQSGNLDGNAGGDAGGVDSARSPITGGNACTGGHFVDERDGKSYPCVEIAGPLLAMTWMAANLDFGTRVLGSAKQGDATNTASEKYCYDDLDSNCANAGALYQWHTAMALPAKCDATSMGTAPCLVAPVHQGLCPKGWHVPSSSDWAALLNMSAAQLVPNQYGTMSNDVGERLKSTTGWTGSPGNGTNSSGFNALPAGQRTTGGIFNAKGFTSFMWGKDAVGAVVASCAVLRNDQALFGGALGTDRPNGQSLRCAMD